MNGRELFRLVALHFAIGAILGALFMTALLVLHIHRISDVVLYSTNSIVTTAILVIGAAWYFAFGAAITGFHFVVTAESQQRDGHR